MIPIYDTDETKDLLRQAKELDNNFNISEFFRDSLRDFVSGSGDPNDTITNLILKIEKLKFEEQQIQKQIEICQEKLTIEKIKKEDYNEDERNTKIRLLKRQNEREKYFKLSATDDYGLDEPTIKKLLPEYLEQTGGVDAFLNEKGFCFIAKNDN